MTTLDPHVFSARSPSFAGAVLMILSVLSCSKGASPQQQAPSATASATVPTPETTTSAAQAPSTPAPAHPRMLAHLSPAWGKHGKLPAGVGIAVGQTIPDVAGRSSEGQEVNLREAAKDGPIALLFYRGGFCQYVSYHLRAMVVRASQFDELGIRFVMVSPDSVEQVAATKAAHNIKWTMLSDPELKIIKAFKLAHEVSDTELAEIEKYKMELPKAPDGKRPTLTNPAIFLVDKQGKVRFAHAETRADMLLAPDQVRDGAKTSGLAPAAP